MIFGNVSSEHAVLLRRAQHLFNWHFEWCGIVPETPTAMVMWLHHFVEFAMKFCFETK